MTNLLTFAMLNLTRLNSEAPKSHDIRIYYRVEIKHSGTPPNETYGWKIHRNSDVSPILRSHRIAGLADANRSRRQLVDADLQHRAAKEQ